MLIEPSWGFSAVIPGKNEPTVSPEHWATEAKLSLHLSPEAHRTMDYLKVRVGQRGFLFPMSECSTASGTRQNM